MFFFYIKKKWTTETSRDKVIISGHVTVKNKAQALYIMMASVRPVWIKFQVKIF